MDYRFLGNSGLQISTLTMGTMTFGGTSGVFKHVGNTDVEQAKKIISMCLEAGINIFDTADVYSDGQSEEILGTALTPEQRKKTLIATKVFGKMGPELHDAGLSRLHIIRACEDSLRRLKTDYIDLYQVHLNDALVPLDETLSALDWLIHRGKVRYIGCSNYSGWHLMKALGISQLKGYQPFVSQQVYYSILSRELENELIPLALDQQIGTLVWSPLSFGLLSGKYRKNKPAPDNTRLSGMNAPGTIDWEKLYAIVDVLEEIAKAKNKTIPQVAINWLLRRPGITSVIIGARTEEQLKDNLGSVGWSLSEDEVRRLEKVSDVPEIYPYWHQHTWGLARNPVVSKKYIP